MLMEPSAFRVQPGVMRHVPRMPVRVDEDTRVPAPESRGWLAANHRAGRPGLADHGVDRRFVSEADYIAAQDLTARRGPDSPAGRCYLLAGLLRRGTCGRLLESCWSNGKAAYRCRHGHTTATRPDPARPKNAYIREDQILARLPALAILRHGFEGRNDRPQIGQAGPDVRRDRPQPALAMERGPVPRPGPLTTDCRR